MRELCKSHNLALADDGKCIVCRRPAPPRFAVRPETEDALSRIVTTGLGVCLLGAFGALAYLWWLDPAFAAGGTAPVATWTERPVEKDGAARSGREPRGAKKAASAANAASAADTPRAGNVPRPSHRGPLPPLVPEAVGTNSVRIVMYGAPWCYVCDRARDFLGADVVELIELDVEGDRAAARALAARNPMQTLPTFEIRGQTIVGFSPYDLEQAVRAALAPPLADGMLAARRDDPGGLP